MPLRKPVTDVGRHQERLLAITRDEILRHPGIVLNAPDGNRDLRDSLAWKEHSAPYLE